MTQNFTSTKSTYERKEFSLWLKTISIYFLPDVMRSQDARILILEEEVKTSAAKETETIKARDQAVKEVQKH